MSDYIKVKIGDYEVQVNNANDLPISIDYALEDDKNFQSKKSSEAFDIVCPAILSNSQAANTFSNPSIEDLTVGKIFNQYQKATIQANGQDLIVGQGILKKATHTNVPISYTWNIHGDNADWLIQLKDTTLYDILRHISFILSKQNI